MDSILYLGTHDEKLPKFLEKLGYGVFTNNAETSLADMIAQTNLDLILVDGRAMPEAVDLCSFFRTQENSKALPIVYITPEGSSAVEQDIPGLERCEIVKSPVSIGLLAGRIATQLRLRKFAGKDELKSTLAEMNSTLRDYNTRFKKELEEARSIQRGLLPSTLPSDSRFQLAVSYEPLEEVGGDWYFATKTAGGKIAMQIADVTGHGLGAAFVGSMAKLAMAAVATDVPDRLLAGMNRLMAPQIPPGRFVTMGSCLYDPTTGKIQFARAGHPPALLMRRKSSEVVQLMGDGFAIGFFEDSDYSLVEDQLEPGDVFFLYTDGISEAQNRSMKTYGLDRLAAAMLQTSPEASPAEILGSVLDDVDTFREERIIKDDVTAIVLKRLV